MSATAAAKLPKVPPSTFSVLLRRSKFATYDPQIGQIYTTYDGSAHRGDWGIKRPLAVRRRDGRVIIKNIDTLYQQTEWKSAYSDAMIVRKFEELQVTPYIANAGNWGPRLSAGGQNNQPKWMHDSDYVPSVPEETDLRLAERAPLPNTRTMSPKRFERYLRRVNRLGPEFRAFVKEKEDEGASRSNRQARPVAGIAKTGGNSDHVGFLSEKFVQTCNAENSTVIRPMPHPTGGLTYVRTNDLQAALDAKAVPGRRLLVDDNEKTSSARTVNVALGGWIAKEKITVKRGQVIGVTMTDIGTKTGEPRKYPEAGKDLFKAWDCSLINPPEVVGKDPKQLDQTSLRIDAISWSDADKFRDNPHKPGTVEYIAHSIKVPPHMKVDYAEPKGRSSPHFTMTNYPPDRQPTVFKQEASNPSDLIGKLQMMTKRNYPSHDGGGR